MSDHISRYKLLAHGLVMLLAADLALAVDGHWSILLPVLCSGACIWVNRAFGCAGGRYRPDDLRARHLAFSIWPVV